MRKKRGWEANRHPLQRGGAQKWLAARRPAPVQKLFREASVYRLEAALFAVNEPIALRRLAKLADIEPASVRPLVDRLNTMLDTDRSAFRVAEIAGGFQMLSRPELYPDLANVLALPQTIGLTPALLETLAIIAYRQPVTRADLEAIRGVQSGELINQLMDRGLVRFCGREDTLGRPHLYGTTRKFMQDFGLRSLSDLPMSDVLCAKASSDEAAPTNDSA